MTMFWPIVSAVITYLIILGIGLIIGDDSAGYAVLFFGPFMACLVFILVWAFGAKTRIGTSKVNTTSTVTKPYSNPVGKVLAGIFFFLLFVCFVAFIYYSYFYE